MDYLLVTLISIGLAGSVLLVLSSWRALRSALPAEDRTYSDPLPPRLRLVWPLVRLLSEFVTVRLPPRWLEGAHERLSKSGASYLMTGEQYLALRLLSAILSLLAASWAAVLLHTPVVPVALLAVVIGSFFPVLALRDRRLRRNREIGRLLPVYLDYITLAVEAGSNFSGALAQAVNKGPKGALRQEFTLVLRDVKAGLPRSQALKRLDARIGLPEVGAFVAAANQAERAGGSLGTVLRAQAERSRSARFQRAEKAAMEAPVKLLVPLVLFIFPTTFIVIGFPIVVMFMKSGAF